jgi:hypothetical protein
LKIISAALIRGRRSIGGGAQSSKYGVFTRLSAPRRSLNFQSFRCGAKSEVLFKKYFI